MLPTQLEAVTPIVYKASEAQGIVVSLCVQRRCASHRVNRAWSGISVRRPCVSFGYRGASWHHPGTHQFLSRRDTI